MPPGDLGFAGDHQPPDYRGFRACYGHALAEMAGALIAARQFVIACQHGDAGGESQALAAVRIRLRQYSISGARAQGILAEVNLAGYIVMTCLRSRERGVPAGAGPA